ncbi:MAG: DUF4416 family protein [Pirellulales bacterium]
MGEPQPHSPVLFLLAAFSRHEEALDWAESQSVAAWGKVALASPAFPFADTDYYDATMGINLRKRFWAFERLFDPAQIVERKRTTNEWEAQYAASAGHAEPRPLNLDPGYITLGKLVLASTKDHYQRLYLDRGIYAEVTLHYRKRHWQAAEWTFADYRRPDFQDFFTACRDYLKSKTRD